MTEPAMPPTLNGVPETALYVDDIDLTGVSGLSWCNTGSYSRHGVDDRRAGR